MNIDEPTPISPDGQEPITDLFGDMIGLADQVAARIPQHEVEARLRRVLRRAGHHGPAGRGGRLAPFTPEAADAACRAAAGVEKIVLSRHVAEARLREAEQLLAAARQEAVVLRAEAREMLTLAKKAYAAAHSARAEAAQDRSDARKMLAAAAQVMDQARSYDDIALARAASILTDARTEAAHARAEAENALAAVHRAIDQLRAYDNAALARAASILRNARDTAHALIQAARDTAVQRWPACRNDVSPVNTTRRSVAAFNDPTAFGLVYLVACQAPAWHISHPTSAAAPGLSSIRRNGSDWRAIVRAVTIHGCQTRVWWEEERPYVTDGEYLRTRIDGNGIWVAKESLHSQQLIWDAAQAEPDDGAANEVSPAAWNLGRFMTGSQDNGVQARPLDARVGLGNRTRLACPLL